MDALTDPARARTRLGILQLALRIALLPAHVLLAEARTPGMVADNAGRAVLVFDAEAGVPLGTVGVGSGVIGDCSITADGNTGFVTDFNFGVWVIDLAASPPALAEPGPIVISNPGEDTVLSVDERFLVVCDGFGTAPVSVVDVATRSEVSTFSLGSNCSSVDVCPDGSVLVASSSAGRVHRLFLDDAGALTHSGEQLATGWIGSRGPNNVHCAPEGASGVVIRRNPATLLSFTVPGLRTVDQRPLTGPGFGLAAALSATRVYARSDGGTLDVFDFDPATGALGAAPSMQIPVAGAAPYLGIDPLALDPGDARLWISEGGSLALLDAATGARQGTLPGAPLADATGVCFARPAASRCGDGVLDDGEACDDGNDADGDGCSAVCEIENRSPDCATARPSIDLLWPPRGHMEAVTVAGVLDPDGDPVSLAVTAILHDEPGRGRGRRGHCPAATIRGEGRVDIRAERDGGGDGRMYHVLFTADDGRGGSCAGEVAVCVPLTPDGAGCGDQGRLADAESC